jgi:hypothetical protein
MIIFFAVLQTLFKRFSEVDVLGQHYHRFDGRCY